jgi:RNA polymerase sigma-70 factor (ECF subfamily)
MAARIRDGDTAAESELVHHLQPGLQYMLRRLTRRPDHADDLLQETLALVLQKVRDGDLQEPQKLAAFTHGTARNLFLGEKRKQRRRGLPATLDQMEEPATGQPDPLDAVLQKERVQAIQRIVAEIRPERNRLVLFRFYLSGDPKEEICRDLEISSLNFNRILYKARRHFKKLIQRDPLQRG